MAYLSTLSILYQFHIGMVHGRMHGVLRERIRQIECVSIPYWDGSQDNDEHYYWQHEYQFHIGMVHQIVEIMLYQLSVSIPYWDGSRGVPIADLCRLSLIRINSILGWFTHYSKTRNDSIEKGELYQFHIGMVHPPRVLLGKPIGMQALRQVSIPYWDSSQGIAKIKKALANKGVSIPYWDSSPIA